MERHPFPLRALLLVLALCAPTAFAQAIDPASNSALPSTATIAVPAGAAVDEAMPSAASSVDLPAASSATLPSASSVALPTASTVAVPAAAAVEATAGQSAVESDYDAIYGADATSVVDPTLPAPATLAEIYDPWQPFNRRIHRFNNAVDRRVAKPLAKAYMAVVPRPIRLGVSNFFSNLQQPLTALNSILQGKPKHAAQALGRFTLNATLGLGGIFDPATEAKLPHHDEDFGQTLGTWGWKRSRYVEVPLFGPRTVRDLFGMAGDAPVALLRGVEEDKVRIFMQGLQLVDLRTQLLSLDSMREGAADDYTLVRDAWMQRRHYQIFGDREMEGDSSLPDYLREEDNPTVPIDAIPVTPMDGS